ncbi:uncharacterized protein DEA37_0012746 [Paragonimus westermani]|uniref:Uncharacterized protein n=1 Tax=Paragonimus westermani TaxID=34504 RepID=A0A5J4NQI1_9TREM|nr:uncharacterized protein DEA37_0012746 [Paragonimus westermani]
MVIRRLSIMCHVFLICVTVFINSVCCTYFGRFHLKTSCPRRNSL